MDDFIKIPGEEKVYTKKNWKLFRQRSVFENYYLIDKGNDA